MADEKVVDEDINLFKLKEFSRSYSPTDESSESSYPMKLWKPYYETLLEAPGTQFKITIP